MDKKKLTTLIKNEAFNQGFDLFGVSPASKNDNPDILNKWLNNGHNATMDWIEKRKEERNNIYQYFPEVKTVISFGYNYYTGENDLKSNELKISNYAWGDDYHLVIKNKLFKIINLIKDLIERDFKFRVCVDTSPILEKQWAQKGGLGWIGKHTNLINENLGSWFFLSEILLDFDLEYDFPFMQDLCGSCTKCIDECPTNAIIDEYQLDANKCISYLTIEHRDEIPEKYEDKLDDWIFGCDICQQVCPWNIKFSQKSNDDFFKKRNFLNDISNKEWFDFSEENFKVFFKNSPIKRTKYEGLKRNIEANKKNKV